MLNTKQPVLRRFWYAVMPVDQLKDGPRPFTLLGEPIVLFLDAKGEPAALEDRCCHRTAKLSKGWCHNGNIVCGYHGWEYDRDGKLVMIPQFPFEQPIPDARARSFRAQTRYGYVWVALDEPLSDIPDIPEERDRGYRRIHQFYDKWNTAALRLMENSFDNAHFAFVHKGTFGDINQPKPEKYEIVETDYGFDAETLITSIRHIIFNCATPISDGQIQVVQILYRNDTEADCSTQELIDWDAAIIAEDRDMLESTDPDAIVDMSRKIEKHMPSDRPGMIMRDRLLKLLQKHHEKETTSAGNRLRPLTQTTSLIVVARRRFKSGWEE